MPREVVFLPPAARPPPADGSPQGSEEQFSFTITLPPPPTVPGGQEKRKHLENFLLGLGALKLRQVGGWGEGRAEWDLAIPAFPEVKSPGPQSCPHSVVALLLPPLNGGKTGTQAFLLKGALKPGN